MNAESLLKYFCSKRQGPARDTFVALRRHGNGHEGLLLLGIGLKTRKNRNAPRTNGPSHRSRPGKLAFSARRQSNHRSIARERKRIAAKQRAITKNNQAARR